MPTRILSFGAGKVHRLDVDLPGLISRVLALAADRLAFGEPEAVAVMARFAGGWHVFDFEEFRSKCNAFADLSPGDRNGDSVKRIFDIGENTAVPVLDAGHPDATAGRRPAVVLDHGVLSSVWVRRYRPGAKPPLRDHIAWKGVVVEGIDGSGDEGGEATGPLPPIAFFRPVAPLPLDRTPAPVPAVVEPFRRTPHLDASVPVCPPPGDAFDVEVFCDTGPARPGEDSAAIKIDAPPGQDEFPVQVFLSPCKGLRVVGASVQALALRRSEAVSGRARFRVAVDAAPPAEGAALNAYFYHDGRPCGHVTRTLASPGTAAVATAATGRLEATPGAVAADLTVSVTRQAGSAGAYRVKVSSPHLPAAGAGDPGLWDLGGPSRDYVAALFANFVAKRVDPAVRLAALRGAGENLFDAAPKEFRDAYEVLSRAGKLRTMLVVSDEPYIPWELMVPPASRAEIVAGVERDPIGVAQAVGRWLSDGNLSPATRLRIGSALVVAPDYAGTDLSVLAQSPAEAEYLHGRLGAEVVAPADYVRLAAAFAAHPPELFHFIGHGNSAAEATAQCLHLEGIDSLKPDAVRGAPEFKVAFARKSPLVFLNACEVGQQTLALGGPAGFAPTLIRMLASGVIAPLWSVRDSRAHEVARALYEGAVPAGGAPVPVAEVLRGIRARAYRGPEAGEDTYAAYCFYGDPNFVMEVVLAGNAAAGTV